MVVSRSVDTLIWVLVFIIVVGPGSLAGVLAVAVRSIGFESKLLPEGIEEIDRGQVEALTATGANRRQVLLYAIVPQVRPVFAGVSIYRWDISVHGAASHTLVHSRWVRGLRHASPTAPSCPRPPAPPPRRR